ncbi:MAG: GntR family transcriptional regulator [Anaerolineaceae bacterium]|nr:GntR family transcriptional regulator [Anaerolineaceae bacterium]
MPEVKKVSLSKQAYQVIKQDIVTCTLSPGQLIGQAELTTAYEVGITPIREALRQLAQEGFVQSVPRLGYIVSLITIQDVEEIYEMRMLLETAAVRMAATRATDEQLKSINHEVDFTYTYKDTKSYSKFLDYNAEFHHQIALASGNQRLVGMIDKTLNELNRVFHLGLDYRDSAEEMHMDHTLLARALSERDADAAEHAIHREVTRSRERVLQALKRLPYIPYSAEHFPNLIR